MTVENFEQGEILFKVGDRSGYVYLVVEGSVEILKSVSSKVEVVGVANAGDYVGEISSLIDRNRSHSARVAKSGTRITKLDKDQFLRLICSEPDTAYSLMTRLCERLHATSRRSSDDAVQQAVRTAKQHGISLSETAAENETKSSAKMTIFPETEYLSSQMPKDGIALMASPFIIGRKQLEDRPDHVKSENWLAGGRDRRRQDDRRQDEILPMVHLQLVDSKPFRLSRLHFLIQKMTDGEVIVRDLGSMLGTQVNKNFLGADFSGDFTTLDVGENIIFAGGSDTPFKFRIVIEQA